MRRRRTSWASCRARLSGLDADWPEVTTVDVYTVRPLDTFLADTVLQPAGAAAIHGVRWFPSRPPLVGLEYEMDLRGVVREVVVWVHGGLEGPPKPPDARKRPGEPVALLGFPIGS